MKQLSLLPEIIPEQTLTNPLEIIKNRQLPDLPITICYGGGTNSTALIISARLQGKKIDSIIFSDTGNERPRTYEFLEWFDEWLQSDWEFNGKIYPPMPGITVVRKSPGKAGRRMKLEDELKNDYSLLPTKNLPLFFVGLCGWLIKCELRLYAVAETLGEECIIQSRLPSKAYGYGTCSRMFKIVPIDNYIKANYKGQKVIQWVGIHAHEVSRLFDRNGVPKPLERELYFVDYPLIKMGLSQQDCENLCKLLPRYPGKSSCWFCPNTKMSDVLKLKEEHPGLYELGCFMEAQDARFKPASSSIKGLGRSYRWADLENYSDAEVLRIDSRKSRCACTD